MKYFKLWLVNISACVVIFLAYLQSGDTIWIKAIVGLLMVAATVTGVNHYLEKQDEE